LAVNFFTDKLPFKSRWIVWDKIGNMKLDCPFSECELAWTNLDGVSIKKYLVIQAGFIAEEKNRVHPTQKPVKLFRNIIKDNTNEDGIFAHWWDYGYWVQTLGKRATIADGGMPKVHIMEIQRLEGIYLRLPSQRLH